jgi:hypothetical protein
MSLKPGLAGLISWLRTLRWIVLVAIPILLIPPSCMAGQSPSAKWHAMGSVPCSWSVPIQARDHTLDVPATIRLLRANHFSCYVQPIEERSPMSYADFQRLLPAAQSAGISVWAVLIPHHEGASLPYRYDFVRWVQVLARLSLKYPALRGINIDDTDVGGNDKLFTHEYFSQIYRAKQKINPKVLFVPTIYDLDPEEVTRLTGCVDGVWLWWVNLEQNNGLRSFLKDSRIVAHGRFPVYGGVYAHSTSWHKQSGPKPKLFEKALELACTYSDGAIIWQLPLTKDPNPWLEIARTFTAGGTAALAGKCGQGHE